MRGLAATTCAALVAHAAAQPAGGTPPAPVLEGNASGVFLNDAGDVLTARHAVTGCRSLFVLKDGRVAEATVRAISSQPELDVAVLRSDIKPYLGATFPRGEALPTATISVFSEAHGPLQRMADRSAVLGNALTVPGAEGLQLLSGAKPGASGSAVLDAGGLLLGVVVER
ncbi:serine protease, partial [Variovorax sp. CT11-76]